MQSDLQVDRDLTCWEPCMVQSPSSETDESVPLIVSSGRWEDLNALPDNLDNMLVITTNYDPLLHVKFPGPSGERADIYNFTEMQRSIAAKRVSATTAKNLEQTVRFLFY